MMIAMWVLAALALFTGAMVLGSYLQEKEDAKTLREAKSETSRRDLTILELQAGIRTRERHYEALLAQNRQLTESVNDMKETVEGGFPIRFMREFRNARIQNPKSHHAAMLQTWADFYKAIAEKAEVMVETGDYGNVSRVMIRLDVSQFSSSRPG